MGYVSRRDADVEVRRHFKERCRAGSLDLGLPLASRPGANQGEVKLEPVPRLKFALVIDEIPDVRRIVVSLADEHRHANIALVWRRPEAFERLSDFSNRASNCKRVARHGLFVRDWEGLEEGRSRG